MNGSRKFFVYGTLKVGGRFATRFDSVRTSSTPAFIAGHALYNLGWFPTVKAEEGSIVQGELHEYDREDEVLRAFDAIEGYSGNPDHDLYNRTTVEVTTDDGEKHEATLYVFAKPLPPNAKKIEDGVWQL